MRKVLLGIAAAATVLIGSIEMADAQQRQRYNGGGYAQQYRGGNVYRNNGNRYVQNNYYGGRGYGRGNGNAWAAGAAGLAVGAVLGAAIAAPNYGYAAQPYWGGGAVAPPVYVAPPACAPVMVGRYWNGFNWVPQYAPGC